MIFQKLRRKIEPQDLLVETIHQNPVTLQIKFMDSLTIIFSDLYQNPPSLVDSNSNLSSYLVTI